MTKFPSQQPNAPFPFNEKRLVLFHSSLLPPQPNNHVNEICVCTLYGRERQRSELPAIVEEEVIVKAPWERGISVSFAAADKRRI